LEIRRADPGFPQKMFLKFLYCRKLPFIVFIPPFNNQQKQLRSVSGINLWNLIERNVLLSRTDSG
jgi:hypothetical protein